MSGLITAKGIDGHFLMATVNLYVDGNKIASVPQRQTVDFPIDKSCTLVMKGGLAPNTGDQIDVEDNMHTTIQIDYDKKSGKFSFRVISKEEMDGATSKKQPIYYVAGVRGRSLRVYEDKCVITTTAGVASFITGNGTDGEKTIYYKDVIGVQFKKAAVTVGYLQLETASSQMNNRNDNFFNENSFTFGENDNEQMETIAEFVKGKIDEYKSNVSQPVIAAPVSEADELLKFKQLLDAGVITQEEFDLKKKQLLGL